MQTFGLMLKTFTDRYPLVGPIFWALSVQYFITQIVVASAWKTPFSVWHNTLSDLGNSACGMYGTSFLCSPLHSWMNASFMMLGVSMIVGSVLIYHEFYKSSASAAGFMCMGLAGLGTLFVGAFPENTISQLHILGAALPFILGNIALIVLGTALGLPRHLRYYTIASGIVGLIGLVCYLTHIYVGLGKGGMERVTAYPQAIWLIAFGLYMSRDHFRAPHLRRLNTRR